MVTIVTSCNENIFTRLETVFTVITTKLNWDVKSVTRSDRRGGHSPVLLTTTAHAHHNFCHLVS